MYTGVLQDLNKIRIKDMCNFAVDAGFTILVEKPNPIAIDQIDKYLTDGIRADLPSYSDDELVCSSHRMILSK
jgi:hypothetical protein